ncbi:hypothetical protein ABLW17_03670 [Anaerococcus murdochii]|uniref:DUF2232 domain-containing protein n=1 Tax=Anaerococcus murdochii TaxID=411577 RepID=A0ABS7SWH3_9FIRM|nr:hypothetical protein [Anaerococcus murdochii]MBZ2385876.1 hypothetical protein [Anaerococcus murdochii]
MTLTKNTNRIMEPIFVIALTLLCLFFSEKSLVFIGMVPILFTIFYFNEGILSFLLGAFGTYLLGLIFVDKDALSMSLIALLLISLSLIVLIGLKFTARVQIIGTFVITSLIFIFLYKYQMLEKGLSIDKLAINLKENFEDLYAYRLDFDIYRLTTSLYPAILAWVSMFYAILSVKIIRNYLSIKDEGFTDVKNLDELRMNPKDLVILFIIEVAIYFLGKFFAIKDLYLLGNLILLALMFFAINGASLFDYILKNSKLPLSRGFQWFFMLILIQVFIIPLLIIGIADIFIDFRARRKNEE